MDERVINVEISKLIQNSFQKVIESIKNGSFPPPPILRVPTSYSLNHQSTPEDIKKKLYYARLYPEIDKSNRIRLENSEKRAKSTEIFRSFYKEYLKEKPLFIRKAEIFKLREKIQSERQKTLVFKELKEIYKPHDLEQLRKHQEKYRSVLSENKAKRTEKIREINKSFEVYQPGNFWKGETHKRLKELISADFFLKKTKKRTEEKNKNKNIARKGKSEGKTKEIGLKYLDFSKKLAREHPNKKKRHHSVDLTKDISKNKPIVYKNYLKELTLKPHLKKVRYYESWKLDFNDKTLKSTEKYSKMLNKVEFLDSQAILYEKQLKYCEKDLLSRHKLNELLINSVAAKISILRDL